MCGSGEAIGGYRYALWFVDRRYKHIEQYPLKYLPSNELIKSLRLFRRDMGGRYPNKMIVDRKFKLIGGQVAVALEGINEDIEEKDQSDVTSSSACGKNQSNLPEIKWRHVITMVCN